MKTLISMTDFVLSEIKEPYTDSERLRVITNYAAFLKQPLKLEMFVPCVNGELFNYSKHGNKEDYEQAREKVLFEDFEVKEIKSSLNYFVVYHKSRQIWISWTDRVIEDFILNRTYLNGLELTPTALKQIGLCPNMEVG